MAFFEPIFGKLRFNKFCGHILQSNVIQIEPQLHNIKEEKLFFFSPLSNLRLPLYRSSQHSQVVGGITWRTYITNFT